MFNYFCDNLKCRRDFNINFVDHSISKTELVDKLDFYGLKNLI